MREKRTDPAICPHCKTSFEDAGPWRYRNLKRHIENVHPIKGKTTASVGGPGIALVNSDNNVNVNITLNIQSITQSDYTALLEGLKGIIETCIAEKKPMIPEMMTVLHETNSNIVIPNKNKDEVLVKGDRRVEVLPVAKGVKICVDAFIKDGIPKVEEKLDETPASAKCKQRLEIEKVKPDLIEKEFTENLKTQNPKKRRDIVKALYDSDY